MTEFIERLRAIVGEAHVLLDPADRAAYQKDWRGRYQADAVCVVRPASTQEVADVVRACAQSGYAIVPQGGNTSHVGGSVPLGNGREVIISTSRMNRILSVDAPNNTMTVEAGTTLAAVQAAALDVERLFPLSLASEGSCQIGGNLASNAGGVHVLRYGNMRDLVLGIEAVLPDGRIWNGLRGLRKDNTGYDLKHLFIGSEGTLGIITAAVLKLFPLPRARAVAWVAVPDAETSLKLFGLVGAHAAERLSAFEIIGANAFELVLRHIQNAQSPLATRSPWYALIELADSNPDSDVQSVLENVLGKAMEQGWVTDATLAANQTQLEALWMLRESVADAQKIEGFSIKHDISLPVSRIPEFLHAAEKALIDHFGNLRIVAFGHAGDGNLHYNLSRYETEQNAELIARTPEANRIVYDIVASYGGSISAEHGLGQLKREEIRRYKSEVELDVMRSIKHLLDPQGIMNPGKLL